MNLEKQRIVENTFVKLINDNGSVLQEEKDIVQEIGTYYRNLYKYYTIYNIPEFQTKIKQGHYKRLAEEESTSLE